MDPGFRSMPWVLEAAFEGQEGFVCGHATGQWFPRSHVSLWVSRAHLQNGMSPRAARVHRGIQWTLSGERPSEEAWTDRGCFPKHSQGATAVTGFCRVARSVWKWTVQWVCTMCVRVGILLSGLSTGYVAPKPCL